MPHYLSLLSSEKMKFLVSFSLIAFSVSCIASAAAHEPGNSLQKLIAELKQFTQFMGHDQRDQALVDLANLENEFGRVSHDSILTRFWEKLLKLGGILFNDLICRSKLTNTEFLDTLSWGSGRDPQRNRIGGIMYDCLLAEVQLMKETTEAMRLFVEEVESRSRDEDVTELREKYGPVKDLLDALVQFSQSRGCEVSLIFNLNLLGAAAEDGDKTARNLVLMLEQRSDRLRDNLVNHFANVILAAKKCEESGLLFHGAVNLMSVADKIY